MKLNLFMEQKWTNAEISCTLIQNNCIVYMAASLGVILDSDQYLQSFFGGGEIDQK